MRNSIQHVIAIFMFAGCLAGCSKSPGDAAVEFITAADQGRTADAAKLLGGGTTGMAMLQNMSNSDPWIARDGEPVPNWVDHVTVTKITKVEKETYGEDLEEVVCEVTPKTGQPATADFYMKKTADGWIIYESSTANVPEKKWPYR